MGSQSRTGLRDRAEVICHTRGGVYVSRLLSQFVPASSAASLYPHVSSVRLCLYSHPENRSLYLLQVMLCLVAQSCPTLCDHMGCSPPGSSVRGILQARVLEWVAMPSFSDYKLQTYLMIQ